MIHCTVRIGTVLRALQLIRPPPAKTSTREERCYARQSHGMPPTCAPMRRTGHGGSHSTIEDDVSGTVQELEGLRPYRSCRPLGSERYGARWSPRQGSRASTSTTCISSTVTRLALEGLAAPRDRSSLGHSLQYVCATFLMLPISASAPSTKLAELERDERREKKHLKGGQMRTVWQRKL
jgi:hypothetical protein